jgi:hypothetical protein
VEPEYKDKDLHRVTNLFVASAAEAAGNPILFLEGHFPHQVTFVFRKTPVLLRTIEAFHSGTLSLPAKRLLYAQKELKDRLWEESRL